MRRLQLQFTDAQAAALETSAVATGRPLAAVVREAVELWREGEDRARRIERALTVAGGFRSGLHDVSERHDEYLAADIDEEMRERWR